MKISSFVNKKEEGKGGWQKKLSRGKLSSLYFPCRPIDRTLIPQRLVSTLLNSLATVDILHDFRSYLASLCLSPLPSYLLLGSTLLIVRYSSLVSR